MNYGDKIKETSNSAGAAVITLAGAVAPYRAFSALAVGTTRIPVEMRDASGNWLVGRYTLSAANTLTRTTIESSSNGGAEVTFAAGAKTVSNVPTAGLLTAGLVDPEDVGFDIILLAGQSNMAGRGTLDVLVDLANPRIMQFGGYNSDARFRTIFSGADPLHQIEGVETGLVGPGTHAAQAYCLARRPNRRVLLVPTAMGGTTMVALTPGWGPGSPGGSLYENAITQANLAVTAALTLYPNSRFVGTLWHQGESDGDNSVTQAAYATALKAVITGFRARITGAAASWFVIGGMTPEGIAGAGGSRAAINAAHIQVAAEVDRCAFVAGPSGMGDTNHYTAAGIRILGARMGLAVEVARYYVASDVTAPVQVSAAVANATPTVVSITMTEALDPAFVPAVSAFTVGGHVVSSVAISGNIISLTCSAAFVNGEAASTVAYTQPGTNNVRDLAATPNLLANFTGLAITNNVVAAASAVTMTGPTGGVVSTASTAFSVGVSPVGGTIPGTVVVTPSDAGGGGTFAPTTVSLTTAAPTATFTYTPSATAGARTISATNNGALTNPASLTYTSTAAATVPATMAAPTATAGDTTASVAFVMPSNGGSAIIDVTITASTGQTVTVASSPATVTGLANGTAVTFTGKARNAVGTAATASPPSNSVTPVAAAAFATYDPAFKHADLALSNGNNTVTAVGGTAGGWLSVRSTISKAAGKWYCETTHQGSVAPLLIGVADSTVTTSNFVGETVGGWGYYSTGNIYHNGVGVGGAAPAAYTSGDVIGMAIDMDAKTLTFFKNGVQQGPLITGLTGSLFVMGTTKTGSPAGVFTTNFGASAFTYAPPAGHVGLQ